MGVTPEIRVGGDAGYSARSAPAENALSLREQVELRRISKLIYCDPDKTLYSQGEPAKFIFLVAEGIVRINRCDESGHRQVLVFRFGGDFCGIPHEGAYFNTAETISDVAMFRFEWREMQDLFLTEPHLQSVMLKKILNDYRQAQTRISELGQQNICQRLATFLVDLTDIPEFFEGQSSCLSLPISRFDIADYLGTAPETIARSFAKLESLGLLRRITARSIAILDVAGLRSLHSNPRRGRDLKKPPFSDFLDATARRDYDPVGASK